MHVNVMLFDGFTSLDFIGPVEALQRIEDYEIHYCSIHGGTISNGKGFHVLTEGLDDIEDGILLIPGGMGTRQMVNDKIFIDEIRRLAESSKYCLTVCTGSAVLAKTGLLDGRHATSNKKAMRWVKTMGITVIWQDSARWTADGKYYTSSGVSAGIDMALGFISDRFSHEEACRIASGMEYLWNEDPTSDPFADREKDGSSHG